MMLEIKFQNISKMNKNLTYISANVISILFNPYCLILLLLSSFYFLNTGFRISFFEYAIYSFLNFYLPVIIIAVFIKLKYISDFEITDVRERFNYFSIVTFLVFLSFIISYLLHSSISSFLFAFSLLNLFTTIISKFYKISGHLAFDTLILWVLFSGFQNIWFLIIETIILCLVAWSRIMLKKHTLDQVILGTLLGLLSILIYQICLNNL